MEPLPAVRARLVAACERSGRRADDVRLVAVVKGQPAEAAVALHALGERDFAENRAEALLDKARALPADARWHFIGNLQRNKLRTLAQARPLVHSFDRPDLADAWPAGMDVLLQVHLGGSEHRNGLPPEAVEPALAALEKAGVACRGLSLLPPRGEAPRPHFARLRGLRDALAPSWPALRELSMGMSGDFEEAVEEGATMVRVGRALFS